MKRGEVRDELRRRRKEIRRWLRDARQQARGRVDERLVAARRDRRRRRAERAVGLAVVVAVLSFVRCDCGEGARQGQSEEKVLADAGVKRAADAGRPPGPLSARVERLPRATYLAGSMEAASWLDEFRLQVAARSPRLAQCFTGSERPGALRWSVALNPSSGVVADHELEPVGVDPGMKETQRECIEQVLSNPAYRLKAATEDSVSRRVSLVIEF